MQSSYRIFDAHAHIFPEKIAAKATESIGSFYDLPMDSIGVCEELIKSGDTIGVSRYLVCSTATVKEQVIPINNFIKASCDRYPDQFIGFGTLHPDMEKPDEEIKRLVSFGFKGIKLHPDFQRFNVDDQSMDYIYSALSECNMPVLTHAGDDRYDYSAPYRIANVAKRFPKLKLIAPHFGGYMHWDDVVDTYIYDNLLFDTCSALSFLDKDKAAMIIEKLGYKRFFFGSDFPMWRHSDELDLFLKLGLTPEQNKAILSDNLEREIILQKIG